MKLFRVDRLQCCVKVRDPVLRQEAKQVEANQVVFKRRSRQRTMDRMEREERVINGVNLGTGSK